MNKLNAENLKKFSDGLLEARLLSQQRVDAVGNADGYRLLLEENSEKIRALSEENNVFLNEVLKPIWESREILDDRSVSLLNDFLDSLLVSWPEEDLDLSLHFCISQKLYNDALKKGNDAEIIKASGTFMTSCYNNMNRVNRVRTTKKLTDFFQKLGFDAANSILVYLDKDRLEKIDDPDAISIVYSYSRFYLAMYDTWYATDEIENEERIDGLVRSVDLSKDEWYQNKVPGYNWKKHVIRCYEHMGQLTENGNQWKMTHKQCLKMMPYMDELKRIWNEDPAEGDKYLPRVHFELILARNSYFSGRINLEEYKDKLITLYDIYANDEYDMYSVLANIFIPTEYLAVLDGNDLKDDDKETLLRMYRQISGYILTSRGSGSFSFMLEYLNSFLERFIDIPGKYTFEEMTLNCLAALHPESYIRSVQTAHVARCLASYIIKTTPFKLIDMSVCKTLSEVLGKKDIILQNVFHTACCINSGEMSVMDTVLTCGRRLLVPESALVSRKKDMSIYLLKKHHVFDESEEVSKKSDERPEYGSRNDLMTEIIGVASDIVRLYDEGYSAREIIENSMYHSDKDNVVFSGISDLTGIYEDITFILSRGKDDRYLDMWFKLNDVHKGSKQTLSGMLEGYVMRTSRIRELSAPGSDTVSGASEYENVFLRQFSEIGQMAVKNKEFLSRVLYPLTGAEKDLSSEDVNRLYDFCFELMNGQDLGDIDQGLTYFVSRRILEDAHKKNDPEFLIKCLDLHISSCYEMAHQAKRMYTAKIAVEEYRNEGLRAAKEIWSYADKDKFLTISEESRQLVLINLRYAYYLYETAYEEEGVNDLFIKGLEEAYAISEDPFYRDNAGDYDWDYHRIRSLEYLGQSTECGNFRLFDMNQCKLIFSYMEKLKEIVESDEKNYETLPDTSLTLLYERNKYFSGQTDIKEYRDILRDIYSKRKTKDYDFNAVFPNLVVPLELLISFENGKDISDSVKNELMEIYRSVIKYVAGGKNGGSFSLLLEYMSEFIYHFEDLEGVFTFEQMALYSMAALHPPTYIHSVMVGELSACICNYLMKVRPELFDKIAAEKGFEKISDFCYHAAVCHDVGKIPMIDTIFIYGRNLLDHEFALLKHHSSVGGGLLLSHASTHDYSDIAKGHHKWYNNSRGYPEEYDNTDSVYKILTDIVTVADCLDAATDTVGRSYTGSKTPENIFDEIKEGGGTRYNPDIAELFNNKDLCLEIKFILDKVRRETYQKNYHVLSDLLGAGEDEYASGIQRDEHDEDLKELHLMLDEEAQFKSAYKIVNYDLQTVCPEKSREDQNALLTLLSREAYKIRKKKKYTDLVKKLYPKRNGFNSFNRALLENLYKQYLREKDFSAESHKQFDEVNARAYTDWLEARKKVNYGFFRESLSRRIEAEKERVSRFSSIGKFPAGLYDRMLDEYEPGLTVEKMDALFENSIPAIRKILKEVSSKNGSCNYEFLTRPATDEQQASIKDYLLDILGFDKSRGLCGVSVHPFTERLERNDTRITTYYDPNNIFSNIYSVIHECGHALFEQLQPEANHVYHIADNKTMGQHETVSRFYENIIGRSREFTGLIYPRLCEVFPDVMEGVSAEDLYRGVNYARPSLIRMDADELTYVFHIYIRYEMEKGFMDGSILPSEASEKWTSLYKEILGIEPANDLEGILQDIHWTDSFGYFPTYALGNFYGAMILNRMKEDFDLFEEVKCGNIAKVNEWMADNVFVKADRLLPFDWIADITGRSLTADDFVSYLEKKYLSDQEI